MAERITSIRTYVIIYIILMLLLAMTMGLAYADLGRFEALPAYLIGALKAILVVLFFMEVRVQSRVTWLLAGVGFVWLAALMVLSMADYTTRGWTPSDEVLTPSQQVIIPPPR